MPYFDVQDILYGKTKRKMPLAPLALLCSCPAKLRNPKRNDPCAGTNHIRCARHGVIIVGILRFYSIIQEILLQARFFGTYANQDRPGETKIAFPQFWSGFIDEIALTCYDRQDDRKTYSEVAK